MPITKLRWTQIRIDTSKAGNWIFITRQAKYGGTVSRKYTYTPDRDHKLTLFSKNNWYNVYSPQMDDHIVILIRNTQ